MPYTVPVPPEDIRFSAMPCNYEPLRDRRGVIITGHGPANIMYMHFHDCIELYYVEQGELELLQPTGVTPVHGGQLILLSSFVPHGFRPKTDVLRWTVIIPRAKVKSIDQVMGDRTFARTVIDDEGGKLLDGIRFLYSIDKREGCFAPLDEAAAQELMSSAALTLIRSLAAVSGLAESSGSSVLVLRAMDYLNLHFREDIRIPELARRLYCNQTTLAIQFKRVFGMTMSEYLNRVRAAEAKQLLAEDPTMTLQEAADRSGFGSLRSLYRAYRREYGTTPGM